MGGSLFRAEAEQRGLSISFSVTDMREAIIHHRRTFDLVLACDNAFPHLLSDDDILTALRQLYRCTRSGGGCLISVRDYEKMERADHVQLYGIREEGGHVDDAERWVRESLDYLARTLPDLTR